MYHGANLWTLSARGDNSLPLTVVTCEHVTVHVNRDGDGAFRDTLVA
jgi:hypothetical protein